MSLPGVTALEEAKQRSGSGRTLASIPLRAAPNAPDGDDSARAGYINTLWHSQDAALRGRDREIEDHVRMLLGHQWSVYNPMVGKYIDVSQFLSDDEKRWRQRPVFNRLLPWFTMMHARMTENPAIVTFVPGPDRADALLAETLDTVVKAIARECGMSDAWDRVCTWMLVAGEGYLLSSFDEHDGEQRPRIGEAPVPVIGPDDQPIMGEDGQPVMEVMPDVPMDEAGQPLMVLRLGPNGEATPEPTGEPFMDNEGRFVLDTLSPLEVRSEWGPMAFHRKRWHMTSRYHARADVEAQYGVTLSEGQQVALGSGTDAGELKRLLYGSGYYGAAATLLGGEASQAVSQGDLVNVKCLWTRPTGPNDKGRYLCVAGSQVLYDGPRPIAYPYTSPLRCYEFVRTPGRQGGSSPMGPLIGPQRAYNRRWAQLFDHSALVSNPKPIIDSASGLQAAQWSNIPGQPVFVNKRPGVNSVEWLSPPSISSDVWRLLQELRSEFDDLSYSKGASGGTPTTNASGELVKELRFNSDRPLGATLKRAVDEWARWNEDLMAMIPVVWPFEKVIRYAGDDNRATTVTLQPSLFKQGKVDVVPDAESMLPEGRGERQERARTMWLEGALGPKDSPQAVRAYLEMARFPHLQRAAKPGGVDHTTASQENGEMLSGAMPPIMEWYDHITHLDVHESFMKAPEFRKLDPQIQQLFAMHRGQHLEALMAQMPPEPSPPPAGENAPPPPSE